MRPSPPEQKFVLRKTTYSIFVMLVMLLTVVTSGLFIFTDIAQRPVVYLVPPLVLLGIIVIIINRIGYVRITPESVSLKLSGHKTRIDFKTVTKISLTYNGLAVIQNNRKLVYINAAWTDAGAAAEYVIHRLNDLGLLDAVELYGDTEKIAAVADHKDHIHFQTRLQHRFLGKFLTHSDDTGNQQSR